MTRSTLLATEFEALRPRLAVQYPFELDFFQKQAILRLERGECVFGACDNTPLLAHFHHTHIVLIFLLGDDCFNCFHIPTIFLCFFL